MAEKSQDEEEDELKFDSCNFNALRALTLGNVPVPFPNVRPLNNLAQYRSFTTGKNKKKGGDSTAEEGETSKTTARRGPVPAPRPAHAPPAPEPREEDGEERRFFSRHRRNFITRMEEHDQIGPMSLLRRSVYEQLRVKVWIRSAAYVRGFCQGFVVAYDRHFNMAMIDVDETYRKPIFPIRNKKPVLIPQIIQSNTPPPDHWESEEDYPTAEQSGSESDTTEKDATKFQSEVKERHCLRQGSSTVSKVRDDDEPKRLSKQCLSSVIEPCLVYNRLKTKVCHRHVNQLFIRGDNVVSIGIIE